MLPRPSASSEPQREAGPSAAAAILIPVLVAVAVGVPSVHGSFIRDDWDYVGGNPHVVCSASVRDVVGSPFQPLEDLGLYRPVTTVSLRIDAWLGGEDRPWIFHATNLALAAAAAALAGLLARNLAAARGHGDAVLRAALVAGLVFAAHPVRTEAVCWVSGRAENLMTLFSLATLVLASGAEALWRTALAAVLAVLAALSKEQGFALFLLVPVVAPPSSGKRFVQAGVVMTCLGLAFILRFKVIQGLLLEPGLAVFEDLAPAQRPAQGLRLLFEYARATAWPHPLLFEYDAPALGAPRGFRDPRVLAGAAILALLLGAIAMRRRWPLVGSGAAIFLFPLLPVLHVFAPIGEDFAERFLALPVAGAALVVGALAARFKVAGFGTAMLVVAACGAAFTVRAADYASERVMYEGLLARRPESPAAKSLLASSLLLPDGGRGRTNPDDVARAERLLREAVTADPGYAPARVILATAESQRRAAMRVPPLPADVEFLEETVRRFPRLSRVHGMLGVAWYERSAADRARPALERELAIMPLDATAAGYLARLLEESGDQAGAARVVARLQSEWEALWRRFPGFGPVAIACSRAYSEGARDLDRAREILRESLPRACRGVDRRAIEDELTRLSGR